MIDWTFSPENQKKYDDVLARNRRLQAELGIESRTIEQRAQDYVERQKKIEEFNKLMGTRRPAPKWKL